MIAADFLRRNKEIFLRNQYVEIKTDFYQNKVWILKKSDGSIIFQCKVSDIMPEHSWTTGVDNLQEYTNKFFKLLTNAYDSLGWSAKVSDIHYF